MSPAEAPRAERPQEVLAIESVRLALGPGGTVDADFALHAGELALVVSDDPLATDPLIDALCGLARPEAGRIRVLGRVWAGLPGDVANALRGRIATIATDPVFPSNMGVGDSAVMAPLYHTRRPAPEILSEAARLARSFGLPGLPLARPRDLGRDELIRVACVRALLGAPDLLVLDETRARLPEPLEGPVINAVRGVCARGGAVLWLTGEAWRGSDARFPATARLELRNGRLEAGADTRAAGARSSGAPLPTTRADEARTEAHAGAEGTQAQADEESR